MASAVDAQANKSVTVDTVDYFRCLTLNRLYLILHTSNSSFTTLYTLVSDAFKLF